MKVRTLILGAAASAMAFVSCSQPDAGTTTRDAAGQSVIECIMTRSSVRAYTDRSIAPDTVETLLRAAMSAPTAVNKQPWTFTVITDTAVMHALGDTLPNAQRMLSHAPLAIVVAGDTTRFLEGEGREYWVQDCSAATENLLLAAHSMGLGAVWCGIYPISDRVAAVQKALDMPQSVVPLCIVPVGYPSVEPNVKDKWDTSKIRYIRPE